MQAQYPAESSTYWWALALSGVVTILFGLAAVLWPGLTLIVLIYLFGIYAIVDGVLALVAMFRAAGAMATWWPFLLVGAFGILAGLIALFWPGVTALVLLFVIAIWAIAVGVAQVVGGIFTTQWLTSIVGVISIVFGFVLFANPMAGALALVWVIGAFAIVRGIILLVHAVQAPAGAGPFRA